MLRLFIISLAMFTASCTTVTEKIVVKNQFVDIPPVFFTTHAIPTPMDPNEYQALSFEQREQVLGKFISDLLPVTYQQQHQLRWIDDWSKEQKAIWEQQHEPKP